MRSLILLLVVALGTAPPPTWAWPVEGPRVIARPYLAPATPYGPGHRGIDVEVTTDVLLAPADGVVHFAGTVVDRGVLSIRHDGGIISSYEPVETDLVEGDRVRRGEQIGTIRSGHCPLVRCVHIGVRIAGEYVSPLLLFGGLPRSVLYPTRTLERRSRQARPAEGSAGRARSQRGAPVETAPPRPQRVEPVETAPIPSGSSPSRPRPRTDRVAHPSPGARDGPRRGEPMEAGNGLHPQAHARGCASA